MSNNWTDQQLEAAILAYLAMQYDIDNGIKLNKTDYYRKLVVEQGRNKGAWERRMQNISHLFGLMGRSYVSGLKPQANAGANVFQRMEKILARIENRPEDLNISFHIQVQKLRQKEAIAPPKGNRKPKSKISARKEYYRAPKVKAWILQNSNGKCENCDTDAPFFTDDGMPFLETHHVHRLADGGPDTVENTVALCPNCHREFHYGSERGNLVAQLREKISRLSQ